MSVFFYVWGVALLSVFGLTGWTNGGCEPPAAEIAVPSAKVFFFIYFVVFGATVLVFGGV